MTDYHVDEDPHIKALKDRTSRRSEEREKYRDAKKLEGEREGIIADTPQEIIKDYWCRKCEKDLVIVSQKCIESDWTNSGQRIAYYAGQCPCGAILKRRISDSFSDPYHLESEKIKKQRIEHYKDIIQPHESGYQMLYGNK